MTLTLCESPSSPKGDRSQGSRRAGTCCVSVSRACRLLLLATAISLSGCGGKLTKRSTIDEAEKLRASTIQSVDAVITPTPVQVETTNPDGTKTTITAAPQSDTSYALSDNTTASSITSFTTYTSIGLGFSVLFNIALAMVAYVFWARFSSVGQVADRSAAKAIAKSRIIENAMSSLTNALASATDPHEIARLQSIRNSLERD